MNITIFNKAEFNDHIKQSKVIRSYYKTDAGLIEVSATEKGIFKAEFISASDFSGKPQSIASLSVKSLILAGTPFQIKVWKKLLEIPKGITVGYEDMAIAIGEKKACRAVASAIGKNAISYIIPCHRVIRKNGALGGFRWGLEIKKRLLEMEKGAE